MSEKRTTLNKAATAPEVSASIPPDSPSSSRDRSRTIHTITDLEPGDHLCCFYETEDEYRTILTTFLRHGLDHHEKILCIVDAHTAEDVLDLLQDAGLDTASYLEQEQLIIRGHEETYMCGGCFDPTRVIDLLQQKTEQALAQGYTALCVAGETTWALRELPGSERLIEYEVQLNTFLPGSRCRVLCQYDMRRFAPAMLLDILRTHPFVAIGATVYKNLYYTPATNPLSPDRSAADLRQWIRNLTEYNQTEKELHEDEERYRSLFEMESDAIFLIDNQTGQILEANHAASLLYGYSHEELLARRNVDLSAQPEETQRVTQGTPIISENLITIPLRIHRKKNGTDFPVEITGRFFVRNGRPVHIAAIRDITRRKQMETQVQRLLEQQVSVSQLALALGEYTSLKQVYQTVYTHVCELMDVQAFIISLYETEPQLIRAEYIVHNGEPFDVSLLPPIPLTTQGGIQSQVIRTGEPFYAPNYQQARTTGKIQYRVLDDGSIQEGPPPDTAEQAIRSALCAPMKIEGQTIGILQVQSLRLNAYTQQDIELLSALANVAAVAIRTGRLIEQTYEQARRVQGILDSVPEGVLVLDANLRIVLANPAAQHALVVMTGNESGDLPPSSTGQPLTHLADRPIAELLTSPPKGQWHEIKAGSRTFEVIARPMQSGPNPEGWVLVIDDATQAREVRAQLAQQERLAAVGQLASGIAHDFNNIMAVIVLYAQMMIQSQGLPERSREQVTIINQQAWNATQLIQQILDFSRRTVLERQPLDLLPLVKEHVKLLRRTLPEHIEVTFVHDSGEHIVTADPTRVQQVIMNLAVNARDAMPEGGTLRIELERLVIRPGQSPLLPEMKAGDWIRLSVADTGTGIPPAVLPHIFEPFFTTKAHGAGSGLGLPQVYGIVEQHEGRIGVDTQVGVGTTFSIYLPALAVETPEPLASEVATLQHGQGETLLVVEDDRAVQAALISTLEALNYTVLAAANGREALTLLKEQDTHIALVLSDVVMPVMGGIALLHALRKQGWKMPMILLTGHPMEKDLEALQTQGLSAWLLKPPDIERLAQTIATALHEEQP